jgi:hypothetical protein
VNGHLTQPSTLLLVVVVAGFLLLPAIALLRGEKGEDQFPEGRWRLRCYGFAQLAICLWPIAIGVLAFGVLPPPGEKFSSAFSILILASPYGGIAALWVLTKMPWFRSFAREHQKWHFETFRQSKGKIALHS